MNANTTVRRPAKRIARRVPVVMQMEALECGAACLTMVAAYYGKWLPLDKVRVDCGTLTWPGDIDIAPEEVWTDAVRT